MNFLINTFLFSFGLFYIIQSYEVINFTADYDNFRFRELYDFAFKNTGMALNVEILTFKIIVDGMEGSLYYAL